MLSWPICLVDEKKNKITGKHDAFFLEPGHHPPTPNLKVSALPQKFFLAI
jgi:hypothetical protein